MPRLPGSPRRVHLLRRLIPGPLPFAIVLAAMIAVRGPASRTVPSSLGARSTRGPVIVPDDRLADPLVGTVRGPVLTTPRGSGALLDTGSASVWLWTADDVEPGDRLEVLGRLRTPRDFVDPGNEDRAVLVASRGADWELTATRVERRGRDDSVASLAWRWAGRLQRAWAARIEGQAQLPQLAPAHTIDGRRIEGQAQLPQLAPPHTTDARSEPDDAAARAALSGIVTGDRGNVPEELDQRWRAVGIYHVLSVSGLHLAVVAGLAFWLLSRLVAMSPWGGRMRPARWAAPIAIVLAVAYTLVTGGQLATVRALIVVVVALVGKMLDRPVRLVDSLAFAAIVILLWRPQDLFDPSFQLSFTAALTLALRPPMSASPTTAQTVRARLASWLGRGLATSAWVALTTAPITALHFHQVAAGGVIGNLVLTPLVELVALPLGLAGVLVGEVWTTGGAALVEIGVWIVARVDQMASVLAHCVPIGHVAIGSPIVMVVLVVMAMWLATRRRRSRADAIMWLAVCLVWSVGRTPATAGSLRVTFVDVGQGDAALVETPGGAVWLVDAGGNASARTLAAASAPGRAITRTLEVYGHHAIDLAIVSHPHPDHYLGLAAVELPVGELWSVDDDDRLGAGATTDVRPASGVLSFAAVRAGLKLRGTRIGKPHLGTVRTPDGVELTVWAPRWQALDDGPAELGADPVRSVNDNSLVVSVSYRGRTILFAGDLEAEGEAALVTAGLPRVDVVKVPHHGSPTSSSAAFVDATAPEVAVISCGVANAFGFPSNEVVERWHAVGARVQRTDLDGAITVTVEISGALEVSRFGP